MNKFSIIIQQKEREIEKIEEILKFKNEEKKKLQKKLAQLENKETETYNIIRSKKTFDPAVISSLKNSGLEKKDLLLYKIKKIDYENQGIKREYLRQKQYIGKIKDKEKELIHLAKKRSDKKELEKILEIAIINKSIARNKKGGKNA